MSSETSKLIDHFQQEQQHSEEDNGTSTTTTKKMMSDAIGNSSYLDGYQSTGFTKDNDNNAYLNHNNSSSATTDDELSDLRAMFQPASSTAEIRPERASSRSYLSGLSDSIVRGTSSGVVVQRGEGSYNNNNKSNQQLSSHHDSNDNKTSNSAHTTSDVIYEIENSRTRNNSHHPSTDFVVLSDDTDDINNHVTVFWQIINWIGTYQIILSILSGSIVAFGIYYGRLYWLSSSS